MKFSILSLAAAAAVATAGAASAHESVYAAPLLGSSEVPAAATTGSGTGRVTINFDLLTMRVEASFSGLVSTTAGGLPSSVTAAHIHCRTAPGSNVGVASQTPSFTGFPLGGTSGSYDHTVDMSLSSSYNAAFISNNGGSVGSAFNALTAGLDAGRAYLNVHTNAFPGGEICGLLVTVPVPVPVPVPEPETCALMLAGLGLVGWAAKRRVQA
jgi:hypothetical protein